MPARLLAPLTAALVALAAAPPAGAAPLAHAGVTCPGSFTVLHDDHIGATRFPAGPYTLTTTGLSCASASVLFARFLDDVDGRLPGGWKLEAGTRAFTTGARAFSVTPVRPVPSSLTCPGTFQVLHEDRIGALALPRGAYRITLLGPKGLSCAQAAQRFARFLDSESGALPAPWKLSAATATFSTSATNGFKVERVGSGGGGRHPSNGLTRCPATFSVLHDDRIAALRLPRGRYAINVFGGLTCAQASTLLREFLARPAGDLPGAWTEVPQTGTFLRAGEGFQVEPAA